MIIQGSFGAANTIPMKQWIPDRSILDESVSLRQAPQQFSETTSPQMGTPLALGAPALDVAFVGTGERVAPGAFRHSLRSIFFCRVCTQVERQQSPYFLLVWLEIHFRETVGTTAGQSGKR